MNKSVFFIAIGLLIAFEAFYLTSKRQSKEDQDPAPTTQQDEKKKEAQQEQTVEKFQLIDAKNQKKEFELWSNVAHKPMGDTLWKLDTVKANIYSENAMYTLTGDKGTVDEVKKTMIIEGHVQMVSDNGYTFHTDHLNYDPEKKKITTEDKVDMEGNKEGGNNLYLEGIGFEVDLLTNQMTLLAQVHGNKPMSDGRTMKIASQTAEMSGKQRSMTFKNNVVINVGLMIVKGNYAEFQYKDGKLDTLLMDGGIHLQDQDKIGSAGIAIVYFNEDKYVFKKKPFITQGENELIGDEIVVFNGGKRVQVKNAKMEYHQEEKLR